MNVKSKLCSVNMHLLRIPRFHHYRLLSFERESNGNEPPTITPNLSKDDSLAVNDLLISVLLFMNP